MSVFDQINVPTDLLVMSGQIGLAANGIVSAAASVPSNFWQFLLSRKHVDSVQEFLEISLVPDGSSETISFFL